MNNKPDKPFLDFEEQIDKLGKEYNLIMPNRDEAKRLLKNLNIFEKYCQVSNIPMDIKDRFERLKWV
ncbi:hypothetical protein [Anaerococcus kampingiae]|uniref:Uncharacterized protein n=1 Tax=Anaerococcus kampingae TaxID=3115614 RepID=A0ABW9MG63_9FIRM